MVSISARPAYKDKSHEELRLEHHHRFNAAGLGNMTCLFFRYYCFLSDIILLNLSYCMAHLQVVELFLTLLEIIALVSVQYFLPSLPIHFPQEWRPLQSDSTHFWIVYLLQSEHRIGVCFLPFRPVHFPHQWSPLYWDRTRFRIMYMYLLWSLPILLPWIYLYFAYFNCLCTGEEGEPWVCSCQDGRVGEINAVNM